MNRAVACTRAGGAGGGAGVSGAGTARAMRAPAAPCSGMPRPMAAGGPHHLQQAKHGGSDAEVAVRGERRVPPVRNHESQRKASQPQEQAQRLHRPAVQRGGGQARRQRSVGRVGAPAARRRRRRLRPTHAAPWGGGHPTHRCSWNQRGSWDLKQRAMTTPQGMRKPHPTSMSHRCACAGGSRQRRRPFRSACSARPRPLRCCGCRCRSMCRRSAMRGRAACAGTVRACAVAHRHQWRHGLGERLWLSGGARRQVDHRNAKGGVHAAAGGKGWREQHRY